VKAIFYWAVLPGTVALALTVLGQNPSYQPDAEWRAPAEAVAKRNPLAKKPEAAAGGKKLFLRNCAECHQDDGAGMMKKHSADFQLPAVQEQSDGSLFWKITNGNPDRGMPSFSQLPEMQRWQLVLFLRTLRTSASENKAEQKSR
jgi:mono/diheme cytochrome c family protein